MYKILLLLLLQYITIARLDTLRFSWKAPDANQEITFIDSLTGKKTTKGYTDWTKNSVKYKVVLPAGHYTTTMSAINDGGESGPSNVIFIRVIPKAPDSPKELEVTK